MARIWNSFWQTVTRYQAEKVTPWLGLRNAVGVTLPLALGLATGAVASGLIVATGALNVSFSDGSDPYFQRARRMMLASVVVGVAVCAGSLSAHNLAVAVAVAALWAFGAGILVALGNAAPDIGLVSLVTLVVFAARPTSLETAFLGGLLAFSGGLLQAFLALALWPIRRYSPERRALADLYLELARAAAAPDPLVTQAPPASGPSTRAHEALAPLAAEHTVESERYRALLSQAERLRLSVLTLARLAVRLRRERPEGQHGLIFARSFQLAGRIIRAIGESLQSGEPVAAAPELLRELTGLADTIRSTCREEASATGAMLADARFQMDAIAGQLRAAVGLAAYASPSGQEAFLRGEFRLPRMLRLHAPLAITRANFNLNSAAFRHAVRLAVCVAAGDAIARLAGWQRAYWVPMTIALVLKPDFTTTFSRGVLRLAGTFAGLLLATGLVHLLPQAAPFQVALIAVMMFIMRCFGPANYGLFTAAVTALVVSLLALTGMPPKEVMAARGLSTSVGGFIALLAYGLWPTWERTQVREVMAQLLDAYREYFRAVRSVYERPDLEQPGELDQKRVAARLARSNLEASVDRLAAEPGTSPESLDTLTAFMASSHRLVHALMSLEGGLASSRPVPPRRVFPVFSDHLELTLYYLAAALRGSPLRPEHLPDLREDHHALVESGDDLTERYALVNVETDRIVNSVNTISEVLLLWLSPQPRSSEAQFV